MVQKVKIYRGYYTVDRRGNVERAKPGRGTRVGKRLKPNLQGFVTLCRPNKGKTNCKTSVLRDRAFKRRTK